MAEVDLLVVLVVEVELPDWPGGEGWSAGPLPVALPPGRPSARMGSGGRTDTDGRAAMVDDRGRQLLYSPNARAHRSLPVGVEGLDGCCGIEVLRHASESTDHALLALHVETLSDDPIATVHALTRVVGEFDSGHLASLGLRATPAPGARVRSVVHAVGDRAPGAWWATPAGPVDAETATLFYLASANTPQTYPLGDAGEISSLVWRLSGSWSCLVLRDGIAFLAHTSPKDDDFHVHGRVYVRTIYLDALLLGLLQLAAATTLANRVGEVMGGELDARSAFELEESLLRFRSRVWWTHLGSRETRVNEILRRVQAQQRLGELVAEITAELTDVARFIEARQARQREVLTRVITAVSAMFLVPSLVFAAAATIAEPSAKLFFVSAVISIVLAGVTLLAFRWMWHRRLRD